MFCAVRCVIIICCYLISPNYWTYIFNINYYACFLILYFFIFHVFCAPVLFCVLIPLLYIAVCILFLYKSTDRCHRLENQLQQINIVSYQKLFEPSDEPPVHK